MKALSRGGRSTLDNIVPACDGGFLSRLGSAILASLVISVVSTILSLVIPDGR